MRLALIPVIHAVRNQASQQGEGEYRGLTHVRVRDSGRGCAFEGSEECCQIEDAEDDVAVNL